MIEHPSGPDRPSGEDLFPLGLEPAGPAAPAPATPALPAASIPLSERKRIDLPEFPALAPEEEKPSKLKDAKAFVGRGFFDPFQAFGHQVDWGKFTRAQGFLLVGSLLAPFLYLLLSGALVAILALLATSLSNTTLPNPALELALYPFLFVLAKGYWLVYLLLPLSVFLLGWCWAGLTAFTLTRGADRRVIDFKRSLSILAMLGAMLAPFTLFPFLRLVALGYLVWFTFRRMHTTFGVTWSRLAVRGGLPILVLTLSYSWFERYLESRYQAGNELARDLEAFQRRGKKLEWPFREVRSLPNPNLSVLKDLDSFSPEVRERAIPSALRFIKGGMDTPQFRFRVAVRLAEMGQQEGMLYAARALQSGNGAPVDLPAALAWTRKAVELSPKHLDLVCEEAKLLFLNKRPLEAKRRLVASAKDNPGSISRIAQFIQREGYGKVDQGCMNEVQNVYQYGTPSDASSSVSYDSRYYRPTSGGSTSQDLFSKRVAALDQDPSQWFLRALVAEYGKLTSADPEVYGESESREERDRRIASGDPAALEVEGDRALESGNPGRARELWRRAALSLNSDSRWANGPIYAKLAESYDPASGIKDPDPAEARKYYLASLLVTSGQRDVNPRCLEALKRLGSPTSADPQDPAFLDLCAQHDIPEAWATLGGRLLMGYPSRNPAKAKECFLKAQRLGYKGPTLYRSLAELDPENAVRWKGLAGKG